MMNLSAITRNIVRKAKKEIIATELDFLALIFTKTPDAQASPRFIRLKDNTTNYRRPIRRFISARKLFDQSDIRCIDLHAQDRIISTRHSGISDISGAFRKDPLISSLYMSVSACNTSDHTIEIKTHKLLL